MRPLKSTKPPSLASHHHVDKRWRRPAPQAAGGETADDRRPRGDRIPARHPRTAPAPCRTKPAAGMSRVDPVGGLVQPKRIDPPAREHIVTKVHVRELKSTAVTPECRRSAASGMRRTIAPRPFA